MRESPWLLLDIARAAFEERDPFEVFHHVRCLNRIDHQADLADGVL